MCGNLPTEAHEGPSRESPTPMQTAAILALLLTFSGQTSLAQATPPDSAHTLFTPNAPDPGRPGQVYQLPQGTGVTTGGTANYQMLETPGGSAIVVPNGNGTSTVIGPGGQTGTVNTPRQ
jgi:hypothetical protein